MTDQPRASAFERHAQSGLLTITVGLLIWIGTTVQANSIKLAEHSVALKQLQIKTADRFTGVEGAALQRQIDELKAEQQRLWKYQRETREEQIRREDRLRPE